MDITVREQLVFPLESRPVLRTYEEFADLPEGRIVQVYSLAETASEKIMALADRFRNTVARVRSNVVECRNK